MFPYTKGRDRNKFLRQTNTGSPFTTRYSEILLNLYILERFTVKRDLSHCACVPIYFPLTPRRARNNCEERGTATKLPSCGVRTDVSTDGCRPRGRGVRRSVTDV